jgi:hypothetical protein
MLEVHINSDAGYDDEAGDADPTKFADPVNSDSTLSLYGWGCTKAINTEWRWHWERQAWPEGDYAEFKDQGVVVVGHTVSLSRLSDKQKALSTVQEFKGKLREHFGGRFSVE